MSAPRNGSAAARHETRNEGGFALLTVMFFVLALTILGLSLFSLSNFEAGFYRPAVHRVEAMQAARSAVDWTRFVVESTNDLNKVWRPGVTRPAMVEYAEARSGGINFDSGDNTVNPVFLGSPPPGGYEPVWIKVKARSGDQQDAIVARFQPTEGANLYKRLITATDYVILNRLSGRNLDGYSDGMNRIDQLYLFGPIATAAIVGEEAPPVAYTPAELAKIKGNWCGGPTNMSGLPTPSLDVNENSDWWTARWAEATDQSPSGTNISFTSGSAPYAVFKTPVKDDPKGGRLWTIAHPDLKTISVTGTCLWMLPFGLSTDKQVTITSSPPGSPATLILVAGYDPNSPGVIEDGVGWSFQGGIQVDANVRLFIVSSGGVELEQNNDNDHDKADVPYLSVYARFVHIQAPKDESGGLSPPQTKYIHGSSCSAAPLEDQYGGLVDQLIKQNLLPNSRFCRHRLALTAGTWQESAVGTGN